MASWNTIFKRPSSQPSGMAGTDEPKPQHSTDGETTHTTSPTGKPWVRTHAYSHSAHVPTRLLPTPPGHRRVPSTVSSRPLPPAPTPLPTISNKNILPKPLQGFGTTSPVSSYPTPPASPKSSSANMSLMTAAGASSTGRRGRFRVDLQAFGSKAIPDDDDLSEEEDESVSLSPIQLLSSYWNFSSRLNDQSREYYATPPLSPSPPKVFHTRHQVAQVEGSTNLVPANSVRKHLSLRPDQRVN
ncbi:hypothetical protein DL96DRAFT_176478 [Flagelloscypha sp. PMI_526]|nr:hypothetical protein DL96DRAFT_176478 [Flagelloscypha sp. PMI_526]